MTRFVDLTPKLRLLAATSPTSENLPHQISALSAYDVVLVLLERERLLAQRIDAIEKASARARLFGGPK